MNGWRQMWSLVIVAGCLGAGVFLIVWGAYWLGSIWWPAS